MATDAPPGGTVAAVWITGYGEALDWIVWKHYGRQDGRLVETVLEANHGACELGALLPEGVAITLPAVPRTPKRGKMLTRFWN